MLVQRRPAICNAELHCNSILKHRRSVSIQPWFAVQAGLSSMVGRHVISIVNKSACAQGTAEVT